MKHIDDNEMISTIIGTKVGNYIWPLLMEQTFESNITFILFLGQECKERRR